MQNWKLYQKRGLTEMRPYEIGEDMTGISLSDEDKALPSLEGGFIARNPSKRSDLWYVNKTYHEDNYEVKVYDGPKAGQVPLAQIP